MNNPFTFSAHDGMLRILISASLLSTYILKKRCSKTSFIQFLKPVFQLSLAEIPDESFLIGYFEQIHFDIQPFRV